MSRKNWFTADSRPEHRSPVEIRTSRQVIIGLTATIEPNRDLKLVRYRDLRKICQTCGMYSYYFETVMTEKAAARMTAVDFWKILYQQLGTLREYFNSNPNSADSDGTRRIQLYFGLRTFLPRPTIPSLAS